MKRIWTLVIVAVVACALTGCSWLGWPPTIRKHLPRNIIVGPSIERVVVPSGDNHQGDAFTFSAETLGSPVVSWGWDFGGGAYPDTSTAARPGVILVNLSNTDYASYLCTLTVTDTRGNSDTARVEYRVGPGYDLDPRFNMEPTLLYGNPCVVVFSVADWGMGNEVVVTIEVIEREGVTVEPTTMTVPLGSGPHEVTVTNYMLEDVDVTIRITLDNGYYQTSAEVVDTIPGIQAPAGSIIVLPSRTSVKAGDMFTATVCVREIEYPVAYFDCIELLPCDGLLCLASGGGQVPPSDTWNLGWPGGDIWEKDGPFFEAFPDELFVPDVEFFLFGALEWGISALGANPIGAPAGTSGPLFNVRFEAMEPGVWDISFVHYGTHFIEPDGETSHYFTDEVGCEVTVAPAEE